MQLLGSDCGRYTNLNSQPLLFLSLSIASHTTISASEAALLHLYIPRRTSVGKRVFFGVVLLGQATRQKIVRRLRHLI